MKFASSLSPQTPSFESLRSDAPNIALGLAYAEGGQDPVIMAEGPRYRGSKDEVHTDVRWHIGSITKSMTATLVMQQVDKGTLDLDAPIGAWLTNFDGVQRDWQAITLRQLLSHTAGVHPNPKLRHLSRLRALPPVEGRHRVLSDFWTKPPKTAPGPFLYSNLGYMLTGVVLEQVTGQPWETLMVENIAKPLGLTLGFGPPLGDMDPRGHQNLFVTLRPMDPKSLVADNPAWIGPAGSVHMSLADLIRYGQAQMAACRGDAPDFLSQSACQIMQTPVENDYGFGWVIKDDGRIWHNGSNTMWYAILMLDPKTDRVVAVTQNAIRRPDKIDALAAETLSP